MYDFCIVGAGIAGLAVAELLARSGRTVALLDKSDKLCGQASARMHSWFHAGALYSALPNNSFFKTLVGNIDDLLDYYSCFENMNLRAGRNIHTVSSNGWFSNHTVFYAYVNPRAREIDLRWKLPWALAIWRAKRRVAWFENLDFHRVLSDQVRTVERGVSVNLVTRKGSLGFNLGDIGVVLKSKDRTMNTRLIAKDLAASFLGAGGHLYLNTEAARIGKHEVIARQGTVQARQVIVASGSEHRRLTGVETRVVHSPLLVVSPALSSVNFVRMTPHLDQTLNHLYHKTEGLEYSVVGSALYYDSDTDENRRAALETMRGRLLQTFPEARGHCWSAYFGPKTELVNGSRLRNYQYHILDADNCTLVLPGKFSLAFSLAVNTCRHFGVEPLKNAISPYREEKFLDSIVACPKHYSEAEQTEASRAARRSRETDLEPVLLKQTVA